MMSFTTTENKKTSTSEIDIKEAQNEWNGWGTALKPSFEPVIVARKPLDGTCVDNVLKYGTGGINIDECRVFGNDTEQLQKNWISRKAPAGFNGDKSGIYGSGKTDNVEEYTPNGRFPANTILTYDETDFDEVCGGFPNTKSTPRTQTIGGTGGIGQATNFQRGSETSPYNDSGNACRYFYCAKASKKDRDEGLEEFEEKKTGELQGGRKEGSAGSIMLNADGTTRVNPYAGTGTPKKNTHSTVKPTELMQYLVRLVTPKGRNSIRSIYAVVAAQERQ